MNTKHLKVMMLIGIPFGCLLAFNSESESQQLSFYLLKIWFVLIVVITINTIIMMLISYLPVIRVVGGVARFAAKYGSTIFIFSSLWAILFSSLNNWGAPVIQSFILLGVGAGTWVGYTISQKIMVRWFSHVI